MSSGAGRHEPRHRTQEPPPAPDWDNPMPYGGYPEPADTELNGAIADTIRQLQAWVTAAYDTKPPRERAQALADVLAETARQVTEYAETLTPDQP